MSEAVEAMAMRALQTQARDLRARAGKLEDGFREEHNEAPCRRAAASMRRAADMLREDFDAWARERASWP